MSKQTRRDRLHPCEFRAHGVMLRAFRQIVEHRTLRFEFGNAALFSGIVNEFVYLAGSRVGPIERVVEELCDPQEAPEGGYTGHIVGLSGANSQGETLDELKRNLIDAVKLIYDPSTARFRTGVDPDD